MHVNTWQTERWPTGVPRDITGYNKPLFSILDDAAAGLRAKVTEAEIGRGTIKVDLALDATQGNVGFAGPPG